MTLQQLYKKEQLLLNRLILTSNEKTKETIKNQITIINENIKMLDEEK